MRDAFAIILYLAPINACLASNKTGQYYDISAEILAKCPHFNRYNTYSPTCILGYTGQCDQRPEICSVTGVKMMLWLDRFHGIDEVVETFRVSASMSFFWDVPCAGYHTPSYDLMVNADDRLFWTPNFYHSNSANDYALSSAAVRFNIQGVDDDDQVNAAEFLLQLSGVLTSAVDLQLALFPFDEQLLSIEFLIREMSCAVRFVGIASVDVADSFMSPEADWQFLSINRSIEELVVAKANRSLARFVLKFRRQPDYFIWSFMLPCALLSSLQLAAFLIPTKLPDRPIYSVTILLAQIFLQGQILSKIPAKPTRTFLSNYTDLSALFSWLCSIYALASCAAAETPGWRAGMKKKLTCFCLFTLRRSRAIDLAAFLVGLLAIIAINGYAIIVAKRAGYII